MKKLITLMLAAAMMITLASCASNKKDTADTTAKETEKETVADTTEPETTEPEETEPEETEPEETEGENNEADATGALAVVNKFWSTYAEEEKFPCGGGDSENMNFEGPGAFNIANTEELGATLGLPEDLAGSLESAASFMHMMNANTFTGACYEVKEGTDVAAFAESLKTNILSRQWICGIPETLVIINIDNEYVISAFGANDIIETLKTKVAGSFESASVVVETAVTE